MVAKVAFLLPIFGGERKKSKNVGDNAMVGVIWNFFKEGVAP